MGKVVQLCALSEPFIAIHQAVASEAGAFDEEPYFEPVAALALCERAATDDEEAERWIEPVLAGERLDAAATQEQGGFVWRIVSRREFEADKARLLGACISDGKARAERDRQAAQRRKGVVIPALMAQLKAGVFFTGVGLKNGTYVDGPLQGLGAVEVEEALEFLKASKKIRFTPKGWVRIEPA
jgi:hypothetical protein